MTNPNTADFLDMLPSTVMVAPYIARDRFGAASYGPAVGYPAHIADQETLMRGPQGETIVVQKVAWLGTDHKFSTLDQVTLSDGSTPIILAINAAEDETATALYTKIGFG